MNIRHCGVGLLLGLVACSQSPTAPAPGSQLASVVPTAKPTIPVPSAAAPLVSAPPSVLPSAAQPSSTPVAIASNQPTPTASPTAIPLANLPLERVNTLGMKFVLVKPGSFMMGSPESETGRDNDETRHMVTLTQPFYIQTTEVTQQEWQTLMGSNPAFFQKPVDLTRPVEQVSWYDTQVFIGKLASRDKESGSYRLPSEAEWEYSARSGTEGLFVFGSNPAFLGNYAWFSGNNTPNGTKPIRQKLPTTLGLFDIHGNVGEWVQDNFGPFTTDAVTDPTGNVSNPFKVVRGGSWQDNSNICRLANREIQRPDYNKGNNIGFRLVWRP